MKSRYFLPARVQCPEELGADEKTRLERTILEALRRGIAAAAGEMPEIIVADPELPTNAREFFSATRYHDEQGTYAVPNYQEGGAQTEISVGALSSERGDFVPESNELPPRSMGSGEGAEERIEKSSSLSRESGR